MEQMKGESIKACRGRKQCIMRLLKARDFASAADVE